MAQYLEEMRNSEKMGVEEAKDPQTMILDYGGPNVANHCMSDICVLQSSVRVSREWEDIWDIKLSVMFIWETGTADGLIITELHKRKPELVYFQEDYEGEYP